ncbi:putative glycerophosphodiester phosphodiesterase 1 [Nocardioides aquaticus]|uniref:Glycerophosphodiester phosphodiesterase 1 n=2 Tax=Nocardioides aquaticus TaxID=160826 RepID=A0ABX8EEQ0_9ACTN|nr:putative glycerophosphodiester phosphodiesterase 1 [Nocardioides aquaticus]
MSFAIRGTAALASAALTAGMAAGSLAAAPTATAAPTSCDSLEVIAHRGDDTRGIDQNTVAAYDKVNRNGYSIEADVWVDAEQVLWMFHDRSTFKSTGTPGLINQMTTAEVEALRYRKAGSPLLKLEDAFTAFEAYPETRVYLEPKNPSVADDVADAVVARGRTTSTWITGYTDQVRAAQPTVQVVQKVDGTLPRRPRAFLRAGVGIVAGQSGRLEARTVARYQRRGIEVQGRNIKKTGSWRRLIQAGADAQLTDRPAGLVAFCPVALEDPRIKPRRSGRTGPRAMVIRGSFFYDVQNVRVAGREVAFKVASPQRIDARIKGVRAKRVRVYVRTPNGAVERTVRLRR